MTIEITLKGFYVSFSRLKKKTLLEQEEMLVYSIFSFYHNVFWNILFQKSHLELFYSLPNNKFLDVTKWKAFADDKLNIVKNDIFFSLIEQKLSEKEKMLVTSIFSFFYSVFQSLLR